MGFFRSLFGGKVEGPTPPPESTTSETSEPTGEADEALRDFIAQAQADRLNEGSDAKNKKRDGMPENSRNRRRAA